MIKPEESKIEAVRKILLTDWDPLGTGSNPNLADEYDRYIPEIISVMKQENKTDLLYKYLARLENELGVQIPEQQRRNVVMELVRDCD